MPQTPVYLDYNATCPILPESERAVLSALATGGNPSSVHAFGRAARGAVEAARGRVAALVAGDPAQVVFTSGASEANMLALRALPTGRVLVSEIEHDSVLNAQAAAIRLPVDPEGRLDLNFLRETVAEGDFVSVMAVNNETGVIQPIAEIADVVCGAGGRLHIDAVQAAGRISLDIAGLGATAISVSAHKIGGPPGVGALILGRGVALRAIMPGGGQERGRRGGTENTPGIAGFGAAAACVLESREREQVRLAELRGQLEQGLAEAGATVIAAGSPRVANTMCAALPGVPSEKQVIALDLAGFAVSAGSACSSGKVKTSHVLNAMGLPDAVSGASIRVSMGWRTTAQEIDAFTAAYAAMAGRFGAMAKTAG